MNAEFGELLFEAVGRSAKGFTVNAGSIAKSECIDIFFEQIHPSIKLTSRC